MTPVAFHSGENFFGVSGVSMSAAVLLSGLQRVYKQVTFQSKSQTNTISGSERPGRAGGTSKQTRRRSARHFLARRGLDRRRWKMGTVWNPGMHRSNSAIIDVTNDD